MAVKAIVFNRFYGGWATDLKVGLKGTSFAYSQSLDFRKSPSQMSVLPKLAREDSGVVTDLIQNTVMERDGTIHALGDTGRFYKRTTAGVWSLEASLSSGAVGLDERRDADMLLIASDKSVSRYLPLSSNPVMSPDAYGLSYSTSDNSSLVGFNVAAYQQGSTAAYTLPTAINESSGQLRYFQSDIEPLAKVSVWPVTVGTGDWTLTIHDGLNTVLASVTVTNANLTGGAWNDFVLSSQLRLYVGNNARTYHIHLTSSDGTGSVACTTASDLSTCDLEIWADRLVDTTMDYHQIVRFLQYECIANGNYLSTWEPLTLDGPANDEWKRHRLVFPMEYEMIGVAPTSEFLVMALAKITTDPNGTLQVGFLAFWDGTSPTYNFVLNVPEGSPQGLHTYKNYVYYYAGGDWWLTDSFGSKPVKLRSMPGSATEFSGTNSPITVNPYAAAVRRGIHLFAWPSATTNTAINFGVYSWGQLDKNYPESFGYNYLASTGTQNYSGSNNLQLGGIWSYGDLLLMSWRDDLNGGYGIDSLTNASTPAATAVWDSLIFDNNFPNKEQNLLYVDAYYSLPAGATIQLAYKLDREANWHYSNSFSTTSLWDGNAGYCRFNVDTPARCREMQVRILLTCDTTVTTPPIVYSASIIFDDLREGALK
jgi:hypothetical protein